MARRKTQPYRQTRGVRFTDAEWAQVKALAATSGLGPGEYLRLQILGQIPAPTLEPPAAPTGDCEHRMVLVVRGKLGGRLELCQCAACGRIGSADPDEPVSWAS